MTFIINNKDLKNFKTSFKLFNINKILNESSFILFYYYEFLTQKDIIILKKFILENNLQFSLLDKKSMRILLSNNENFLELQEFLQGNVLIIYQLQNNDKINFLNTILNLKNILNKIILFGIKLDSLFFKHNKIMKINSAEELHKKFVVIELLNVLKNCHNTIFRIR